MRIILEFSGNIPPNASAEVQWRLIRLKRMCIVFGGVIAYGPEFRRLEKLRILKLYFIKEEGCIFEV